MATVTQNLITPEVLDKYQTLAVYLNASEGQKLTVSQKDELKGLRQKLEDYLNSEIHTMAALP